MSDDEKNLTQFILNADEKDTPKILLCISHYLEDTSRSIREINKQFEGISTRLKSGDNTMTAIQMKIRDLPCKRNSGTSCLNSKNTWSKTKITAIGTSIAAIIAVIIETIKRLAY